MPFPHPHPSHPHPPARPASLRRVNEPLDALAAGQAPWVGEDVESRLQLSLTEHEPVQLLKMYKAMREVPLEERVQARRSPIHGWGLFTLQSFARNRTCGGGGGGGRRGKGVTRHGGGGCGGGWLAMPPIGGGCTAAEAVGRDLG